MFGIFVLRRSITPLKPGVTFNADSPFDVNSIKVITLLSSVVTSGFRHPHVLLNFSDSSLIELVMKPKSSPVASTELIK